MYSYIYVFATLYVNTCTLIQGMSSTGCEHFALQMHFPHFLNVYNNIVFMYNNNTLMYTTGCQHFVHIHNNIVTP